MRRILVVVIAIVLAVVLILVTLSFLRPGAPPEGPIALTFVVDVPTMTPAEDAIFLEVEGLSFAMNRSGTDRWTITRTIDVGETVPYRYNRNGLGYVSAEAFTPDSPQTWRTIVVDPSVTIQQDVVEGWRWIPDPALSGFDLRAPPGSFPARSDGGPFLTGVDLLDFYRPEFDPLVDSTMQRVRDMEARWVHLVIIYAVVEANPPRLGDAGITMSEDAFRAHVAEARALGLNVSVTIATEESFFPEVRTEISAALSETWFDVYFAELNGVYQQWFPVLTDLGVEMVFVPGSGLYPESSTLAPYVDQKLRDQVAFIRTNYAGLLTSDWVMGEPFRFYEDLDYVGTKWDSLIDPAYATPDDFAVWLDFWAEEELDSLFREYGKPVLVGISWASYEGAAQLRFGGDDPEISEYEPFTGAVPRDLQLQADLFGATLEVLAKRPWIKGTFLFGYRYWTSIDLAPGIRGKPAEDLLRQWYTALNGPGTAATVPSYRDVTFTAHVPANTPPADQVYWVRTTFFEPGEVERVPMVDQGGGTWTVTVPRLLDGALLRYVYDRGWTDFDRRLETREAYGADLAIFYRHLLVSGATGATEDTVAMWADLLLPSPRGTLNTTLRDAATGLPVWDATVSVAGTHIPTDHDGNVTLTNLSGGTHRVTVSTTRGQYRPASRTIAVTEGFTSSLSIDLVPASPRLVTFDVVLPSDSPLDATVRVFGSHFDLGSVAWAPNQLSPDHTRGLVMAPMAERRHRATLTLHEGTYVEYEYSVGGTLSSSERAPSNQDIRLREFVVGTLDEARSDYVVGWRSAQGVAVTINVTVPPNTPPTEPVYIRLGPLLPLTQVAPLAWTFTYYGFPGEVFQYEYIHGIGFDVEEVQADGSPVPTRSVTLPASDATFEDFVLRWKDLPLATPRAATEPVNVTFRVAVPLNTPINETVYVEWSSTTLGSGSVSLTSIPSNRWIWEGRLTADAPGDITYAYARGATRVAENGTRSLSVSYENQVVTDGVEEWSDLPLTPMASSFQQGIGPVDFWSVDFLDLYDASLEDIAEQNAEWVVVSSIWSYGRVNPLPYVEPRPLRAPSVFASTEDLVEVIARIHAHGLKAFIVPQFNMEMTPGGDDLWVTPRNNSWWSSWLDQARRLYLYNALVADQTGAEMLLLPGPGFHVFFGPGMFTDPGYLPTFDVRMQALIGEVRAIYGGLLAVGGTPMDYDFPMLADFVGTTSFALGTPVLENRTIGAIRADYESRLDNQTQPLFARWGRPVIFYQVALGGPGGTDTSLTPGHLLMQATAFEAFFQALWNRTWIEGIFTFGYTYAESPLIADASTRGKPAEGVLSKYFGVLPSG